MRTFIGLMVVGLYMTVASLYAQQPVPVLAQHVMDFTNSLTYNEWRSLEDRLKRVKDTTRIHIAILVVDKLAGESLSSYATKVFKQNQLGERRDEPGVLIVVEKESKSAAIQLGVGLEQVLTNETTNVILEKEILPLLKEDNFYGGLAAGVLAITAGVVGKYEVPGEAVGGKLLVWVAVAILLAISVGVVVRLRKKPSAEG